MLLMKENKCTILCFLDYHHKRAIQGSFQRHKSTLGLAKCLVNNGLSGSILDYAILLLMFPSISYLFQSEQPVS